MGNNKEFRVLQVVHALGMGGAETWLMHLLRYWNKTEGDSLKIDFLITGGQRSIFDEEARLMGSNLFYIELKKRNVMNFVLGVRNILRNTKYAAIHDHQDFLSGWHFLFGFGLLPKIRIVHVHNPSYQLRENYGISFKRRIQSRIGKLLVKKFSTHIGGTSEQVLKEYGIVPEKFTRQWVGAIHCAFPIIEWQQDYATAKSDICDECGFPEDCKLILFAGRLDYSLEINHPQNHKNSVFALNVFEKCRAKRDIRMIMVGANEYILSEFQKLIDEKGLKDKVKLLGIRRGIQKFMCGSDMLLFPSRGEGLGMVAVEAQAAGLPVLASTAVPKECVVIDNLVHFCDLTQPITEWDQALNSILDKPRPISSVYDDRWKNSMFNIEVCSDFLLRLYKANTDKNMFKK